MDNTADVISLDAAFIQTYKDKYNLKPILTEEHEPSKGKYYAVAVVKKNSAIKSFEDLRGKKSCHSEYNNFASYRAPLYALIKAGLIKKASCPYNKALTEFFSGSCAPGITMAEYEVDSSVQEKMCSQCVGNLESNDSNPQESKCNGDVKEAFHGYSGAFRCLASGKGDVAFVRHNTVIDNTDGRNKLKWAKELNSEDYELLCPKGGRASIDKYEECNIAKVPRYMVVTNNEKSNTEIEEIRHSMVTASQFYRKNPELFKLFGPYEGKQDLLFKDSTTALVSYDQDMEHEFKKILTETTC
jgi:melanoma-associated antigen p97